MHLDTFIPAALLILLATSLSVVLFKYLGLGSVLGLLAAGVAIGPHSPGPRITENIADILHFAELGVVLLLFLIGLEMRPSRLWSACGFRDVTIPTVRTSKHETYNQRRCQ